MNRRDLLVVGATALTAVSGCAERVETGPSEPESQAQSSVNTTQRRQSNDLQLVFVNRDAARYDIGVAVTAADEAVLDREITLAATATRTVVLPVYQPGVYTVSATVDGTAATVPLSLDAYDIKLGPRVVIELRDGTPNLAVETG